MRTVIEKELARVGSRTEVPFVVRFAGGGEYRNSEADPAFTLVFRKPRAYWRIAAFGHIGFLESYFDDDLDIEGSLGKALAVGMEAGMDRANPLVGIRNRWHEFRFANSTWDQAKANSRFHSALGTEFYRYWLAQPL